MAKKVNLLIERCAILCSKETNSAVVIGGMVYGLVDYLRGRSY